MSYSGGTSPEVLHARLLAAPRVTSKTKSDPHPATTLAYVVLMHASTTKIEALAFNISEQLDA